MSTYEVNDDIFPYQCAVFIRSRWGNDWYSGSGAIIGNNDILTASHVIYDNSLGGMADEVRVYPSYDPDTSVYWTGYYQPTWYEYYEDWDANGDGLITNGDGKSGSLYEVERDIALLSLTVDIGSIYGYFGVTSNFSGGTGYKLGFPGKYSNNLMFDQGIIYKDYIDNYFWFYNDDIEINTGDSGGPIYINSGGDAGYQVVGVVSSGNDYSNSATSIKSHYWWLSESVQANNYLYDNSLAELDSVNNIDEGKSISFTFKTHKSEKDKEYTYTISGIASTDIASNELTGRTTINADGEAVFTIGISADGITEGAETFTLSIGEKTKSVTINDTSIKDIIAPNISLPTTNNTEGIPLLYIKENTTVVHTYIADESVTWSLSAEQTSLTDYKQFSIDPNSGKLEFNNPPDYDNPTDSIGNNIYALTVNATDIAGNSSSQRLWILVTESDTEKPIIYGPDRVTTRSSVLYMNENETYIHTFVANEEVTWSLPSYWDQNSLYSIDKTSGVLSFKQAPDYENPSPFSNPHATSYISFYPVVRATDLAGNYREQSIFLLVKNIENEPSTTSIAATSTELQQLYIGYFGRPCDPTGLDYWLDQGVTKKAFAANMYLQPEFNSVNGNLSTEAQVNQIYLNLFNREGDAAGLIYWASQIDSGNLELASIANDLTWAALNNAGSEVDKKTLTHKTNAGVQYTYEIRKSTASILAYQPKSTSPWITGNNLTEAKTFIKEVGYSKVATLSEIQGSIAKFSSTPKSLKLIDSDNPNYSIDIVTGLSLDNFSNESTEDLRQAEIAFDNNFSILDQQIENNKLNYVELSDHFTNQKYISNLYEEVLDRNSDIEGLNYCIDQLETIVESRFEVSLGYSSSIENPLIPSDTLLA